MGSDEEKSTYSSADDLWQELGILEDITATAIKRTIAMQIENEMSTQKISKAEMARRMRTSASQLERILGPDKAFNSTLWSKPLMLWVKSFT